MANVAVGEEKPSFGPRFRRNEMWTYFGPAFVASVAYIDPGNFATNIEGGSRFGYRLLWVLLWSNAMAILIQYLSAKLGIVTGLTLPQNCRKHFSRPMTLFLWGAAEVSAIATDLAEFLGAALGLYLLFGPAFVASVAYIDPGNFATNIEGGSRFGYRLLWVLLWSNAMAILIQYLSAKLGIVTGLTLPQNCRKHLDRKSVV